MNWQRESSSEAVRTQWCAALVLALPLTVPLEAIVCRMGLEPLSQLPQGCPCRISLEMNGKKIIDIDLTVFFFGSPGLLVVVR